MSDIDILALIAVITFALAFPAFFAVLGLMSRVDELETQLRERGIDVGTKGAEGRRRMNRRELERDIERAL